MAAGIRTPTHGGGEVPVSERGPFSMGASAPAEKSPAVTFLKKCPTDVFGVIFDFVGPLEDLRNRDLKHIDAVAKASKLSSGFELELSKHLDRHEANTFSRIFNELLSLTAEAGKTQEFKDFLAEKKAELRTTMSETEDTALLVTLDEMVEKMAKETAHKAIELDETELYKETTIHSHSDLLESPSPSYNRYRVHIGELNKKIDSCRATLLSLYFVVLTIAFADVGTLSPDGPFEKADVGTLSPDGPFEKIALYKQHFAAGLSKTRGYALVQRIHTTREIYHFFHAAYYHGSKRRRALIELLKHLRDCGTLTKKIHHKVAGFLINLVVYSYDHPHLKTGFETSLKETLDALPIDEQVSFISSYKKRDLLNIDRSQAIEWLSQFDYDEKTENLWDILVLRCGEAMTSYTTPDFEEVVSHILKLEKSSKRDELLLKITELVKEEDKEAFYEKIIPYMQAAIPFRNFLY